ncbi:hypothetical protein [Isoptericola cucumis]|uniref:Uncharacterized protein n=1 Tax=Isoptericola cucumis TaxID=1776856 RepID=A0ABQ2B584_9MICO|nr:hypothetical protein [Isoptericola cucumis]GGI08103.1 hypothetical protein GCM10007368_19480 [Isoptericola cucumis]
MADDGTGDGGRRTSPGRRRSLAQRLPTLTLITLAAATAGAMLAALR